MADHPTLPIVGSSQILKKPVAKVHSLVAAIGTCLWPWLAGLLNPVMSLKTWNSKPTTSRVLWQPTRYRQNSVKKSTNLCSVVLMYDELQPSCFCSSRSITLCLILSFLVCLFVIFFGTRRVNWVHHQAEGITWLFLTFNTCRLIAWSDHVFKTLVSLPLWQSGKWSEMAQRWAM